MAPDPFKLKVNDREYNKPAQPVVVVCVDGCEPDYITQAIQAGVAWSPWSATLAQAGYKITNWAPDYTPDGGIMWLHIFLVLGLYFLWYWRRGGQTLAMQTWKLRLVNADGQPVSVGQGWLRYALAWPSVCFFGVGLLWALLDRDRQFLHDRIADTQIVTA